MSDGTTFKLRTALLIVGMLVAFADSGLAKEGFYLGAGGIHQTLTGVKGDKAYSNATDTVAILAGKLEPGTGLGLLFGYGFNDIVSLEYLFGSSSHTATHNAVDFKSAATLSTGLIGLRLNQEIGENLFVHGRVGLASAIVRYASFAIHGSNITSSGTYQSTSEVEFVGAGAGLGGGIEWLKNQWGFSANYSYLSVDIDTATAGSTAGKLPKAIPASVRQIAALATYYFK